MLKGRFLVQWVMLQICQSRDFLTGPKCEKYSLDVDIAKFQWLEESPPAIRWVKCLQCVCELQMKALVGDKKRFGKSGDRIHFRAKTTSALLQAGSPICSIDGYTLAFKSKHTRAYRRDRAVQKKKVMRCTRSYILFQARYKVKRSKSKKAK